MISRFIDKLRDTAIRVEIFLEGSTDTIPTDTHEQLRNAADIIWELRNDLQRANNAVQNAEHDESMAWDRLRKAEAENAKLREYAESYAKAVECEGCGWCPYDIDAVCDTETMPMRDGCKLYDELRELGIEVEQ